MKQLLVLTLVLFIFSVTVNAQTNSNDPFQAYEEALKAYDQAAQNLQRSNLRAQKREIIKKAISLTSKQSQVFWPIYERYEAQTTQWNDSRMAVINDYVNHRADLSEQKASELVNRVMQMQKDRLEMKRAYVGELGKVLKAKQALRLLLLEHQMDVQIDAQIAAQIPLE